MRWSTTRPCITVQNSLEAADGGPKHLPRGHVLDGGLQGGAGRQADAALRHVADGKAVGEVVLEISAAERTEAHNRASHQPSSVF
jgi:hypothetical protein